MIAEALRALYDLATKCNICDEHAATRWCPVRGWRVCDRDDCGVRLECVGCDRGGVSAEPLDATGIHCLRCGSTKPPRREPRSTAWRDLPHAAALRAANAAHEAR